MQFDYVESKQSERKDQQATMLPRRLKELFFRWAGLPMFINGVVYRNFRAPRSGLVKVHLGPGQKKYLPGWVNVDANMFTGKCDVWADFRRPLPFHDATVHAAYSHHVVEHLPNLQHHFREVFRCLKPGGVYRVGGPNGEAAMKMFVAGQAEWFSDFPDKRRSLGGKLENFIFCRGEHLTILTASYLTELMEDAGFENVRKCLPTRETSRPDFFEDCLGIEWESDFSHPHTLLVEGSKPETS